MNWVVSIWSMVAASCLLLGSLHVLVWFQNRKAWANLLFAITAIGTAAFAACELWMMMTTTTDDFGKALRWLHLPVWALILGLIGFIRIHLRTGRAWLGWTVCILRTLSLILNFWFHPNLNYREVTSLRHVSLFGESIAVGVGTANPWMLVGQLSLLLLVIFVADASISAWRRGDHQKAIAVGGSIFVFTLMGMVQAVLFLWGIVHAPLTVTLFFMGIILAMGLELSYDVLRAARLAADLRESEKRLNLAADAAKLGFWAWDLASDEIWTTSRCRMMFGFSATERITRDRFFASVHPDDRTEIQNAVAQSLAKGSEYEREYRMVRSDGQTRWMTVRGSVERDHAGKAVLVRGVAFDSTDEKRTAQQIEQHRSELAHLSRVSMLSELSGSLAHELNQPLAIILTNAQAAQRFLAQDPPDCNEALDILADIVSQDQRAAEVIRRLRSLLKDGQPTLQPTLVSDAITAVMQLTAADFRRQGVTVSLQVDSDLPPIIADPIQLQQVLLNLWLNAGDAMSASASRLLTITAARENDTVVISTTDSGCGLPPDPETLFKPFYTTKTDGLGLGLAICRTIISAFKGRLWAEANQHVGATFHLELPVTAPAP